MITLDNVAVSQTAIVSNVAADDLTTFNYGLGVSTADGGSVYTSGCISDPSTQCSALSFATTLKADFFLSLRGSTKSLTATCTFNIVPILSTAGRRLADDAILQTVMTKFDLEPPEEGDMLWMLVAIVSLAMCCSSCGLCFFFGYFFLRSAKGDQDDKNVQSTEEIVVFVEGEKNAAAFGSTVATDLGSVDTDSLEWSDQEDIVDNFYPCSGNIDARIVHSGCMDCSEVHPIPKTLSVGETADCVRWAHPTTQETRRSYPSNQGTVNPVSPNQRRREKVATRKCSSTENLAQSEVQHHEVEDPSEGDFTTFSC